MPFSYIDLARWVFEESGLTSTERLVLLALGRYAGHEDRPGKPAGTCFPRQTRLANDTGLARRTVMRCLDDLAAAGIVSRRSRKGRVAVYDLRQTITCDRRSHVTDDHTGCDPVSRVPVTDDHTGCDPVSPDQIKNRSADPTNIGGGVARARDSHPPPQGPDRASDERATSDQTTGFLADIRQGSQAGQRRPRRQHPREQSYTSDLLSPDAEQIHELLVNHKLPLNSPTGMANLIAGKLGPLGNNKLTVARVKLAVEAVAERAEADAADGAPRSSDEVRAHLLSFLRYTDARWKELEKKLAADEPGPPPDAPAYHRPAPDEPVIDAMPPEEVARLSGELTKKLGLIGSGGMS